MKEEKFIKVDSAEEFDNMFLYFAYFDYRIALLTKNPEIPPSLKEKDLREAYKKLLNSDNVYAPFEYLVEYEKEHYIAFNFYIPYIKPENELYKIEKKKALKLCQTELFEDVKLFFGNIKIANSLGYGHKFVFLIPTTINENRLHQMEQEIHEKMYQFVSKGVKVNHEKGKNLQRNRSNHQRNV